MSFLFKNQSPYFPQQDEKFWKNVERIEKGQLLKKEKQEKSNTERKRKDLEKEKKKKGQPSHCTKMAPVSRSDFASSTFRREVLDGVLKFPDVLTTGCQQFKGLNRKCGPTWPLARDTDGNIIGKLSTRFFK